MPSDISGQEGLQLFSATCCPMPHTSSMQVWSIRDTTWRCKVHQGPSGAVHCQWSPDGSTLVVASDFALRLSAWNLGTRAVVHLKGPKGASQGLQFSPDARQLATLEVLALSPMLAPPMNQGLHHAHWAVLVAPGFVGRCRDSTHCAASQPASIAGSLLVHGVYHPERLAEHARCSYLRHGHGSAAGHVMPWLME